MSMLGAIEIDQDRVHKISVDRFENDDKTSKFWFPIPNNSTITDILFYKASTKRINVTIYVENMNAMRRYYGETRKIIPINLKITTGGIITCMVTDPSVIKLVVYYEC